jgi:hypothetical protein
VLAIEENGTPDGWGLIANKDSAGAEVFADTFEKYLKVIKNCGVCDTGCWYRGITKNISLADYYNFSEDATISKILLADGSAVALSVRSGDCTENRGPDALANTCGVMWVDANGSKPPNVLGKDIFMFVLTKTSIVPHGTKDATTNPFSACYTAGHGCTAWVIFNENMDYLHCNNLSWNGPTKCD